MKKIIILAVFCLLLIGFWCPTPAVAMLPVPVNLPFGGVIITVVPCTCNWEMGELNFYIMQAPVAGPPQLIFQAGVSKLYNYFQLLPGRWILGNTSGVGSCWVGLIPFCVPVAGWNGIALPVISIVGTSK